MAGRGPASRPTAPTGTPAAFAAVLDDRPAIECDGASFGRSVNPVRGPRQFIVTFIGADAMPLAMTTKVAAPDSGTHAEPATTCEQSHNSNWVVTGNVVWATPIDEWLWVRP